MNTEEKNNYIQYATINKVIKTKSVLFVNDGVSTTFEVSGINEPFFLLAVFQNNFKVNGVGFNNIDNNDILGFLNADFVDLDAIPSHAYLLPLQVVVMSYNNEYVKSLRSEVQFPMVQNVNVLNFPENGQAEQTAKPLMLYGLVKPRIVFNLQGNAGALDGNNINLQYSTVNTRKITIQDETYNGVRKGLVKYFSTEKQLDRTGSEFLQAVEHWDSRVSIPDTYGHFNIDDVYFYFTGQPPVFTGIDLRCHVNPDSNTAVFYINTEYPLSVPEFNGSTTKVIWQFSQGVYMTLYVDYKKPPTIF